MPAAGGSPAPSAARAVIRMALQARKKHKFVKAWMQEHVNDHWVKEATRLGYRSRAAFKLLEIAERDQLFQTRARRRRPRFGARQLGAGALRERLGGSARIVAVDLLPMDPVPGVRFVQADFRETSPGSPRSKLH